MSPADSSPSSDILHRLVWHNDAKKLDEVLKTNQQVVVVDEKDGHVPLIDSKYRGTTALGLAAQLGHRECTEVLLHHWADTLTASTIGYYPLQEATSLGDRDMMRMLLVRRHEQLRELWKVRQPALADALHSELPDFFLEMEWHFRSWIPFLSRLCPSDTCRIWKRGNRLRVDSTLMGVEMEKMDWRRGNVSFIFHVNDTNSRLYVLDHDHKLYEEIDKMREFTEDEIEEDLNLRLNTQIYSGKMRKPKAVDGEKRVQFIRQKSLFGLGGDKEEQIGPYMTRVYDVPGIEAIAKYRREHLQAQEKAAGSSPSEMTTDLDSIHTNDSTPHDTNNSTPHDTDSGTPHESLDSAKVLAEIGEAEPHMESMLQDARKNLFQYVPSIPRPKPLPSITETEYFPAKIPLPYMHAGRKMIQSEKSKKFRVSVWMADNFPLTIHQLMPFFEIMTLGNKNFEKLQDFISMELPPGFPVRIEIPLFAFLSAQITFLNFQRWEDGGTPPVPQFVDGKSGEWFEIPADYKLGVVIKNIFKDE